MQNLGVVDSSLVGFNFPEHDIKQGRAYDPKNASFGTIEELLPALYVLKQVVIDQHHEKVDLYGFSAGGGALINALAVLNSSLYDEKLQTLGIGLKEKEVILNVIQQGIVILDVPLKSLEEIIAFRGVSDEFEILAKNYRENGMRPIDAVLQLHNLSLNMILYFQKHDEILSNRDDALYIERLKSVQPKTLVVIGENGGHLGPHLSLWRLYAEVN